MLLRQLRLLFSIVVSDRDFGEDELSRVTWISSIQKWTSFATGTIVRGVLSAVH